MSRAAELIRTLNLAPHPEGGWYREIHRSAQPVQPADGRPDRAALTLIYFLLDDTAHSRWHRVASDELWHHAEGDPLELLRVDGEMDECERMLLGPLADGAEPARVIPAGHWQAARTVGAYTLVACSVAPGFDFADFAMLSDHAHEAGRMRDRFPDLAPLI